MVLLVGDGPADAGPSLCEETSQTPDMMEPAGGVNVEQAVALAYRYWAAGQPGPAVQFCRDTLAAAPGQPDALHLLGLMAHQAGRLDEAAVCLAQACQSPRAPAKYFSNLAEVDRQRGRLPSAEAAARQAVKLDAGHVQGWNNLGIILREAGKLQESLACLRQACTLDQGNPEILNNFGNSLARLGRLEEAETVFSQAVARRPGYAQAHGNLAAVLHLRGREDEALRHAERAISLDPGLAAAYVTAAAIHHLRGAAEAALRRLDMLLGFAPGHLRGLLLQAQIQDALQRHEEALATVRRAAALYPDDGETQLILGKLLQTQGEAAAAHEAIRRAASLLPDPAEAYAVEAALRLEAGDLPEALAASSAALRHNPRSAIAWLGRSELKRFAADDPELQAMRALLQPGGVQAFSEQLTLHFALGKACLDHGDEDGAFGHFAAGNRMKRTEISFDLDRVENWIASIAVKFSAARLDALRDSGAAAATAVFIVGMPRSGTTLVEQILASHGEVHGAGELSSIQSIINALAAETSRPYPDLAAMLGAGRLRRMGEQHIAQLRRRSAARLVVDKMPANFLHAGLIHLILPAARIIHVRRAAADTCLSCYTKLFSGAQSFTYDQTELGGFYRAYEKLMAHWRRVLPADRFLEVDYETVVADLEGQTRRLLDFCGLGWDAACLRFHETERPVHTASAAQVRLPLYRASIGRAMLYRRHLAPLFAALDGKAASELPALQ